jgi:opacity protein-like surface antigen
MNNTKKIVIVSMALTFSASLLAQTEGFYVAGQLGASQQVKDSEPYGNNIAVDDDFPATFDIDNSAVGSLGIGYILDKNIRIEGRIGYRDSDFNATRYGTGTRAGEEYILKGSVESTTFTIEGFYDFTNDSAFTPYIKAGIGLSENSYSAKLGGSGVAAFDLFDGAADGYYDSYANGDSTEFTWNFGVGVSYELSEQTSIYGEYQYASFGDAMTGQDSFTDGFKIDNLATNEVVIGIRITL